MTPQELLDKVELAMSDAMFDDKDEYAAAIRVCMEAALDAPVSNLIGHGSNYRRGFNHGIQRKCDAIGALIPEEDNG